MPHVEATASGASGPFVQAFWQSSGFSPNATHRVLPDACADAIFNLTDKARPTADCASFVGTMTRAIVVPVSTRRDVFGIRFKPGAAWLLYRAPMRALCDGDAPFDEILPAGSAFAERLAGTEDFTARIALAEAWIERRLAQIEVDEEKRRTIAAVNARFESGAGNLALSQLDWNERKLQRFFETAYGTNPATMRCFWRFEHVRRALLRKADLNLATLAVDHGFSDQAHMAREFQRFSGLSITAWRRETLVA